MRRTFRLFAMLGVLTLAIGCATVAGGLIGGGIGRIAGDQKAGAAIGAGTGMLIDIMR